MQQNVKCYLYLLDLGLVHITTFMFICINFLFYPLFLSYVPMSCFQLFSLLTLKHLFVAENSTLDRHAIRMKGDKEEKPAFIQYYSRTYGGQKQSSCRAVWHRICGLINGMGGNSAHHVFIVSFTRLTMVSGYSCKKDPAFFLGYYYISFNFSTPENPRNIL